MALRDFIRGAAERIKPTINLLTTKSRDFGDWLAGIDDEFKGLEKYAKEKTAPFQEEKIKLIDAWKNKQIDEATLNQRYSELTKKSVDFVNSDDKLVRYTQRKKEITENNAINYLPIAGVGGKITGGILRRVSQIANAKSTSVIIPLLKKMNIADDVIKEIAPKLAGATDHQLIYSMTKTGQTLSAIEKKVGYLGKDIRKNLSVAVDRIVKTSPDADIEKRALGELYKKTVKDVLEKSRLTVAEQSQNLLKALKKNLDDIHQSVVKNQNFEDYGRTQDIISKLEDGKPVDPNDTRFAYELLKRLDVAKEAAIRKAAVAEEVVKNKVAKAREGVANKDKAVEELKKQLPDLLEEAGIKTKEVATDALQVAKKATGKLRVADVKKLVREVTGQIDKTKEVITTERKLLREKFKIMQKASAEGGRGALEAAREFKKTVRQYASDLPVNLRRKILSTIKFSEIKSANQINPVLKDIDRARQAVKDVIAQKQLFKEVVPLLKSVREKGLLGKVKMDIRELGLRNRQMIKNASAEKLGKLKQILLNGLDTTPPKIDVSNVDWKALAKEGGVGTSGEKGIFKKFGEGAESALGVISTNIRKYGGDKLFSAIRERRFELNTLGKKAADEMKGFQKGMKKLSKKWFGGKADYQNISHALFNQDFDRARELARKYKFEGELNKVIGVLDDIHKRATEAGLKVGKMQNYFPRIVKDYNGLFKAYSKKFGQEGRSYFDKVLTGVANSKFKKVSELTVEERAEALTNALRGYGQGKLNVGSVGKARQFKELPTEFMKFYHTPENSLVMYVGKMNERISLKKLFGLTDNEQASIGGLVDGLNISPDEMYRLKETLGAILSPQGKENWALNKLRKSATLTLLGNVSSTLFQIADLGVNAYKHGTGRALASLFRSKPFKRDELFTEIAHEFADSNVIKNTLKAVGFDRLDRLNNEAFMANAFREASRYAKKGKGAGFQKVMDYAKVVFRGDEGRIASFLDDVIHKRVTNDTKLYIFNKALDVNPRALEEMPEAYAKHPNARIFYSMKSYGLKILDLYRNDVIREKGTWKKAKNFIRMTAILTTAGATGAQIRDWYNGKDTKFSDNVLNSMFQLIMLSTYDAANIKRDGLVKAILTKAMPISRWMDDISRDIYTAGDGKGLYSLRDIPIFGNELYNRFGRGRASIEKANEKASAKTTKLKPLKKPGGLKKLKKL